MITTLYRRVKALAGDADWWTSMSPEQQKEYLKEHPNSTYSPNANKDHTEKKEEKREEKLKKGPDETKPRLVRKVKGAEMRDHFIKRLDKLGAEQKGKSHKKWQQKLTINDQKIKHYTVGGKPSLEGPGIKKLAHAYAKRYQFKAVRKDGKTTVYEDHNGNSFTLRGDWLIFGDK